MKPIKISEANKAAIVAELARVNGKAFAHAYATYAEVANEADYADKKILGLVGSKKVMVGAKLQTTSGDTMPGAYKYSRIGTTLVLVYKSSGWHLESVGTAHLYKEGGRREIVLTTAQSDKAKADYAKQWSVVQVAPE